MPKYKELFNNDLDESDVHVFDNIEQAHTASIQTAVWTLKELLTTSNGGSIDVDENTDTDEIIKACDNLKKAVRGKFVSRFQLADIEDEK